MFQPYKELLAKFVWGASDDYVSYAKEFPQFATRGSKRGNANWMHDRIWTLATDGLVDCEDAEFVGKGTEEVALETKREIIWFVDGFICGSRSIRRRRSKFVVTRRALQHGS